MLGNVNFRPSKIEDEIYDFMEDYAIGSDTYNEGLVDAITDYLTNYCEVKWQLCCAAWPDMSGGACFVSWVESDDLHAISFDYKKEGYVKWKTTIPTALA